MGQSSLQQMQLHGLQEHLGHQTISMESPMETISLWQWVLEEPFVHHLMELGFKTPTMRPEQSGIQKLLAQQILSMESPLDEA